jgi:hypothetical protein
MILAYAEMLFLTNPGRESGHLLEGVEKKANVILTRVISVGNVTGQSPQSLDRRKNLEKADYVINSIFDLSPNVNRTNVFVKGGPL